MAWNQAPAMARIPIGATIGSRAYVAVAWKYPTSPLGMLAEFAGLGLLAWNLYF
jgi:hypothetical protein